ncbi:MAG TPA: TraB/GumN family protein [Gammaproteobacteria bacterium]|nr:TraB/GumN family protein [Gammaproteobacteria bacterium]
MRLLTLLGLGLSVALAGQLRAQEKSFLWKVDSDQSSLYILGSIHLLNKEAYPLKQSIENAFEQTAKLVLEIDLRSASSDRVQELMLQKGASADGTVLHQKVSKETYESVAMRAKELGIDIRLLNSFKPWIVATTMAAVKLQKLGFDSKLGVDRYFAERAIRSNKPVIGLETAEFQVGLLDQFSAKEQELLLRQSLNEMDHMERNVAEIVRAWKAGDVESLEKHLLAGMRDYPEIHQKVIEDRNRRWLPQIEELLSRGGNALVVVGAAHLVGKNGVIQLLKSRGYRVEQQ